MLLTEQLYNVPGREYTKVNKQVPCSCQKKLTSGRQTKIEIYIHTLYSMIQ